MPRNQHPSEFQEHAVSKARTRGKRTLESVAAELNMPLGTLKGWLKRSGLEGAALPHAATLFNQSKLSSAPPPGQFSVGVNTDDAVI